MRKQKQGIWEVTWKKHEVKHIQTEDQWSNMEKESLSFHTHYATRLIHIRFMCMWAFTAGLCKWKHTHTAAWEMGGETHQAEVISVNMVALGIHIPRQDMVAITWKTQRKQVNIIWGCMTCTCTCACELEKPASYRCCPINPDDNTLLVGWHFSVDVDTFLYEDKHGHRCHESEYGVQDDAKDIQLWRERGRIKTI